eukprot:UN00124
MLRQKTPKVARKQATKAPKAKKVMKKKHAPRMTKRSFASDATVGEPKKTALYDKHVEAGGKMVDFCGYLLPVQYNKQGLPASHAWVRNEAGLFDVSHMGQVTFKGKKRVEFIEKLIVADVQGLKPMLAKLTMLTNENGGVIDDCMITKRENDLYMVLNAGCKDKDMAHIKQHLEKFNAENAAEDAVEMTYHDDRSLVALQGPKAVKVMQKLLPDFDFVHFPFMGAAEVDIQGVKAFMTRCGYTGEDGFEIGTSNEDIGKLWDLLMADEAVEPAGLGVRDSLRLEAGLCLYGHELNETITPVEAGLTWAISPRRKREGGFLGADKILPQLTTGVTKKMMGVEILAGAPARQGATLHDAEGKQVGEITSGGPAPSLNMKKIGIAYIDTALAVPDQELQVNVRGKMSPAKVQALPFVQTNYYRAPKA